MNVTTINQLVSVNILLDQDEALAALKDPRELQRKLREALGDMAPLSAATWRGRRNGHGKPGPKARATQKATPAHGTGRASTTTCSVCGKAYKPAGLGVHMARKHNSQSAPTASE